MEEHLREAAAAMDALQPADAYQHATRALEIEPNHTPAIDALAEAALALGRVPEALDALKRSVELQPAGAPERYMNLGQLHDGADAISYYEQGVRELRAARDALVNAGGSRDELSCAWMEATHKLASGLCSIAELYLTDACDDERAEDNCERLAAEAVELVSAFEPQLLIEPYQTQASLRLSQGRDKEAEALLDRTLAINAFIEGGEHHPPLPLRVSLAKMLMEVGRAGDALALLQDLRLEDDESLELWYLLGCAAQMAGETGFAAEELEAAIQFAESDACPPEEAEGWLPMLRELAADLEHDSS